MSLSLSLQPTLVESGEYDEMENPTVMQIAIQLLSNEQMSERMATKSTVEYAFKIADTIKRHPIYKNLSEWKEGEIRDIRQEEKDDLLQDGKA